MPKAQIITICLALALWEAVGQWHPDSFVIAGPSAIVEYIANNIGLFTRATLATMAAATWGFLAGTLTAIAMASLVMLLPKIERGLSAIALLVFCLPLVATGPILRVLYGTGTGPQISLAALACFYTTYLALLVGLRAVPSAWMDLVRSYGRGRLAMLWHVRVRACVPYLIAGLQIAAPAALLGAMIGEFTGAERGLGVLTLRAMRGLDVDATWALAVASASIALIAYSGFGWLGRRISGDGPEILLHTAMPAQKQSLTGHVFHVLVIALIVFGLWQLLMDGFALNRFFAKRPGDVWAFLSTSAEARSVLISALVETLALVIPGYFAGLLLGAALAIILVLFPVMATTLLPIAVALRSVPIITTAPLIVLALGRGAVGTITIVAVMIFFPTFVACAQGLRQAPGQIIDVFNSYAASQWRVLLSARIPAMLPAFFAAARMAVPAALLAVTTTEWLATGRGIGNLMALTATTSDYNMLWSSIVALSVAAVAGYVLIRVAEKAILSVYASEQVQP